MRQNFGSLIAKRAILDPDLEALVDVASDRRFSCRELNTRVNKTASALSGLGAQKGDRIAVLAMNGLEFVEIFVACAKIGTIVVPLNWRLVADELAFIIKDAGATVLLYGSEFEDVVTELHSRGAEATDIKEWVAIGDVAPFAQSYDTLHDKGSETEPAVTAGEDDHLFIMYTSGTTGLPKGVIQTHNAMIWALITQLATVDLSKGDRYYIILPLFHVGALAPLAGCLYSGVTTVIARAFDPVETWKTIEREKITNMLAVPAMLNFMHQVPTKDEVDRSTINWIMSGAAPVPVSLIKAYEDMGIEIHQVYGLTESCGPGCVITGADALKYAGSTGKGFMHTSARVVDNDGNDVAVGDIGEVILSGPHMMEGYWNRPDATAETLKDGWLYTGDLASIDAQGFIYIQDRKKDMIISGGENIYPAEIENIILSHEGVKDVAVIGQPSDKWGESPFAVVVKADDGLSEADVLKHCEGKLAGFKQPKGAAFITEIPRNPSGKALKRLLRDDFPGPARE